MPKTKMVLSDEERLKRKERMMALRERLGMVGNKMKKEQTDNDVKPTQKNKKDESEKIEKKNYTDLDDKIKKGQRELDMIKKAKTNVKRNIKTDKVVDIVSESEEESEDEPVIKPKRTQSKVNRNEKVKPAPKKCIKIKYYGDISKEEMENDARILESIHKQDNEKEEKISNQKNKQSVKIVEDDDDLDYI